MGEKSYWHQNFNQQHVIQHQDIMERKYGSRILYSTKLSLKHISTTSTNNKTQEILFLPKESPRQHTSDNHKMT